MLLLLLLQLCLPYMSLNRFNKSLPFLSPQLILFAELISDPFRSVIFVHDYPCNSSSSTKVHIKIKKGFLNRHPFIRIEISFIIRCDLFKYSFLDDLRSFRSLWAFHLPFRELLNGLLWVEFWFVYIFAWVLGILFWL